MKQNKHEKLVDTYAVRYENLNGMTYAEYLQSDHWKSVKEKARKRPNYHKCEFCDCQEVELHHTSYKWIFTPHELRAIISLCRQHHQEVHDLASKTGSSVRVATNELRRIYKPDWQKPNRVL